MDVNALPAYDASDNPNDCCPRFNPDGWDGQELHFRDKPFIHAATRSVMHVPLNMGSVFARVLDKMVPSGAYDPDNTIVLSRDRSAWAADHYFATTGPVEGEEMVTLDGDYITKVFEGPYKDAKEWYGEMEDLVRARGAEPGEIYFFYTTCPKCAKVYGKNYVVGVAEYRTPNAA